MAQVLLLNPRKRSAKRRSTKRASPAQLRARANFAAAARARSRNPADRIGIVRRMNPKSRVKSRRRNPALAIYKRRARRRNPINIKSILSVGTYLTPFKEAAIMGAGAVAMDVGFGYVNRLLPASMQRTPGTVGVGEVVKAAITVIIGNLLSGVTRGLSRKAAIGSLTVQAHGIAAGLLPASMAVSGLGFVSAGRVVPGNARVNSNMAGGRGRLAAYTTGGASPLLSGAQNFNQIGAYVGGQSPLLSRAPNFRR